MKMCEVLLDEYRQRQADVQAERILFQAGDRDVYNMTAPFLNKGELLIAGRVEPRDSEHSEVIFFRCVDGEWVQAEELPVFALQDPFWTRIGDELVFGGVEIFPHPEKENAFSWRTVFYRGASVQELQPFFKGPDAMKDIRLVECEDKRIGVFTRPQGEKGGRGKIGFMLIGSLDELTIDLIEQAPLLKEQFTDEEWGGANEVHVLDGGLLGVLGHIARFDERGDRHYYPMVFAMEPNTKKHTSMTIIAERAAFLEGPAKRPDLIDVVFSGGIVRQPDGTAILYAGISDADAQKAVITDPFITYEQKEENR